MTTTDSGSFAWSPNPAPLRVFCGGEDSSPPAPPVEGSAALRAQPQDERLRWTLAELYRLFYRPTRIDGALDELTAADYEKSIQWWVHLTGDPPLAQITRGTCQQFVAALARQPGRKAGQSMAARTVRKHGANVNRVLELAGPWSRDNPDGLDILERVPFCLLPAAPHDEPGDEYTLAELRAMYRAAATMEGPRYSGDPCAWWRTVISVGYLAGMRRGALLALRRSWITRRDEAGGAWLVEPSADSKKGRGRRRYLHPLALAHIDALPTGEDVFAARNFRSLCNVFGTLQRRAGVAEGRHWQRLRQAQLTQLAILDLEREAMERARDAAGHSSSQVTAKHYVGLTAQDANRRRAILALPSPVPENAPDARQKTLF